jgi:UDP-glucose 4-epimerase
VTGGAGYIGSHTVLELLHAGHTVVVADNLSNSSREALRRVEALAGKSVPFYQADIRDKAALGVIFDGHELDCCIHFAGLKAVGDSVREPLPYYENNVGGTVTLLEVLQERRCKHFIFSSSATLYGVPPECRCRRHAPRGSAPTLRPDQEHDRGHPRGSPDCEPAWNVVLLRYFNPVGAHPSGRIGRTRRASPTT